MMTDNQKKQEEEKMGDPSRNDSEPGMAQKELDEMTRTFNESQQQILRLRAELENQKKRLEREIDNARELAAFDFITNLLPVKDSMEKGLDISYMEDGNVNAEVLLEGMHSTLKILNDAFKKAGIVEIDPLGETFNPELHEAMTIKKVDNEPPNKVLSVFQKGYMLFGRLIRPARVEVSGN